MVDLFSSCIHVFSRNNHNLPTKNIHTNKKMDVHTTRKIGDNRTTKRVLSGPGEQQLLSVAVFKCAMKMSKTRHNVALLKGASCNILNFF